MSHDFKSTDNLTINKNRGKMTVQYEKDKITQFLEFSYVEGVKGGSTYHLYTSNGGEQIAMWTQSANTNRLVVFSYGDNQSKFDLSDKDAEALTDAIEKFFNLPKSVT